MTETPGPRAPLHVETDLELTIDGVRTDVSSTGDRLFVDFASLRAARTALRGVPLGRLPEVTGLLMATDLTIEFRSRGRTVAAVGADVTASPLSRRLGFAPGQLRVTGLFGAVGQEIATALRWGRNLLG